MSGASHSKFLSVNLENWSSPSFSALTSRLATFFLGPLCLPNLSVHLVPHQMGFSFGRLCSLRLAQTFHGIDIWPHQGL